MPRNQRIGLLAAAAVVVVVAIVVAVAVAGGGGDGGNSSGTHSFKIDIKGGKPVGGVQNIKVKKGDRVTIVVSSDAHDAIHVHGVDIEKDVEPGKPATFKFTANIEGIFDIESHVAEDAGREPQMGKLTVEPD
jgi:plastocyanin